MQGTLMASSSLSDQTLLHHPDAQMTSRQCLSGLCLQGATHPAESKNIAAPRAVGSSQGHCRIWAGLPLHQGNSGRGFLSVRLPVLQALATGAEAVGGGPALRRRRVAAAVRAGQLEMN